MRVRVMPSRISAMQAETRSNAASTATSRGASRSRRASSLRASTASETPFIIRSSRSTERRIERERALRFRLRRGGRLDGCAAAGALDKRGDQLRVVLARQRFPGLERLDELADPVDHGEHGVDQGGVGDAVAGAHLGERALGGVAQLLEPRQIEKAAIALDGVDEAENLVEPLAVVRRRLPRDDRAGQGLRPCRASRR